MWKRKVFLFFLLLSAVNGMGHPMPHSIFSIDVRSDKIFAELKTPLKELQFALPFDLTTQPETWLKDERRQQLVDYFLAHIQPKSRNGLDWNVEITQLSLAETQQEATGKYQELAVYLVMQPPPGEPVRNFDLHYDAILHQVVTHKIFVVLKNDWQTGRTDGKEISLGVIELNIASNSVSPMPVKLDEGSTLKGIISMIWLGINHIAEGTDHLLFLLVLLLPATFIASNGQWTAFAGTRKSILNVIKIATAFTIGHSLSLFLGAKQWLLLPQQPVEIAIAATIFITAVHAIRPLFANREMLVATAFGLVHGLAFSTVLSELHLDSRELSYSILGYNIGIELMQVFVIFLTMPWIIVLSKNKHLKWTRIAGAAFAMIAALAWMLERIELKSNVVSKSVEQILEQGKWIVLALMLSAGISAVLTKYASKKPIEAFRDKLNI